MTLKEAKTALKHYIEDKQSPGGFLTAVLENDLFKAARTADRESAHNLVEIANYVWNYIPAYAMGSKATVAEFMRPKSTKV